MEQFYVTYKGKKLVGPMSLQGAEEKKKNLSFLFENLQITSVQNETDICNIAQ
jgi:hypothetical protein